MPSTSYRNNDCILKTYENLFHEPKIGLFKRLFLNSKDLPPACNWCGCSNLDIKIRNVHRQACKKLQILWISKLEAMSSILRCKLLNDKTEFLNLTSFIQKSTETFEIESLRWKSKYGKPLKSSLELDLNNFRFIRPLTKGGYGQIFLCNDLISGKNLAVKILSISEAIQKSCIDAYVNEREFLLRCKSEHIISLLYSFKTEFFIYQMMEYQSGGDLSSLLNTHSRFSENLVRQVLAHLFTALKELKSLNIVHGDIKLENLIYCPESGIMKLIDFGLSFSSTLDGSVVKSALGTPEYMAPEQIKYSKKGFFSDMWSVGICIYEMIYGFPPFYADNAEAIMHDIATTLDNDFKLNLENSVEISDELKSLLVGLLDPNYLNRLTLEEAMKHQFFASINWSMSAPICFPKIVNPFIERNKRYNSLQFYNMQTIGTETVSIQEGVFNQQTSIQNQVLLLQLFPIKNLNKL